MKQRLFLMALVVLVSLAGAVTYTDSPAEGSFSSDSNSDFDYKAGEFDVKVEGILPPTSEQLDITADGIKQDTYVAFNDTSSYDCVDPRYDYYPNIIPDEGESVCYEYNDEDIYNKEHKWRFNPPLPGKYEIRAKGKLEASAGCDETDGTLTTEEGYAYIEIGGRKIEAATDAPDNCDFVTATNTTTFDFTYTASFKSTQLAQANSGYSSDEAYGEVIIDKWYFTYYEPIGNTLVNVGGENFTGRTIGTDDYYNIQGSDFNGWNNTTVSFKVDFSGQYDGMTFDDTRMVSVEGEYLATSPSGVSPEAYRWVRESNTSDVLVSYKNLDSGSEDDYIRRKDNFDRKHTEINSGKYILQIRSSAGNYPVEVGVRDFRLKADKFIQVDQTRTFHPQLSVGDNNVEIFTTNANDLTYRLQWAECKEIAKDVSPEDGASVDTSSPTLAVTNSCNSIDNVTFRNADTETVVKKFTDASNGERLEADTDLSIGDRYNWYIRFCDQGECFETPVYSFTVGVSNPDAGKVEIKESTTTGLDMNVRDEDFNPNGTDEEPFEVYSRGFINKLEDDSNQLEPGMETATYGMETGDTSTVRIWNDSVGAESYADQWAITPYRNWSIDTTGKPYPPWNSYYKNQENERDTMSADTVLKTTKAFGNSLAVVAQKDITRDGEFIAQQGAGVWIDPDMVDSSDSFSDRYVGPDMTWEDLIDFDADLTGPDSGIGYDAGD
ncbi:MAG: hypothetical protein ABEK01_05595, partial [Candidatus Nanohaloarchaea archaeon]